ncbi:TIGR00730 family Rossman fold protein [Adlercreutzia sp. ZJ141]|uniref:LOG family protein n=1 Tax=Adlercreutzia sp. ZJ141 TaxID=2709406 RepID=UPI0013ECC009|nr:TIGR00730 family Rossman fold protein [Adlercreutzia sp. ZJ141]
MNITVYCGSNPGKDPLFIQAAHDLGTWIANAGHALVYGGSSIGLMGAVSQATIDAGGQVYGVEPQFFIDAGVAQHDLTELYVVQTMSERKEKMIELGDAFVALPGGVGTLEEISEITSRIRLGMNPSECYFLNINGFYNPLQMLLCEMHEQGFLDQIDLDRIHFPKNLEQLAALIEHARLNPAPNIASATELHTPVVSIAS